MRSSQGLCRQTELLLQCIPQKVLSFRSVGVNYLRQLCVCVCVCCTYKTSVGMAELMCFFDATHRSINAPTASDCSGGSVDCPSDSPNKRVKIGEVTARQRIPTIQQRECRNQVKMCMVNAMPTCMTNCTRTASTEAMWFWVSRLHTLSAVEDPEGCQQLRTLVSNIECLLTLDLLKPCLSCSVSAALLASHFNNVGACLMVAIDLLGCCMRLLGC